MQRSLRFAFAFGSLAWAWEAAAAEPVAPRPNVLFVMVDDLNDWVGCLGGHPQTRTPHLDRLAARGVLFAEAHCAAPVCLASRTAVLSGQHPCRTGVYSNWGKERGREPPREVQLPIRFAAAGYATLGTGKLYHGPGATKFEEYFDVPQRWSPFSDREVLYTPDEQPSKGSPRPRHTIPNGPGEREWVLPLNGLPSERQADTAAGESFDWGAADLPDEAWGDVRITDWACRKLAERRERPWFLGVGYYRPHLPLFAPRRDFDVLPPLAEIVVPKDDTADLDDLGPEARRLAESPLTAGTHELVLKHDRHREAVRAYLACVTFADRQLGRLIAALEASPHGENTWIVVFGDHGWHLGEKRHWGKWTGWRRATRVPLVVVPPRNRPGPRGKVCAEPVSLLDLYPTLAELGGFPAGEVVDGRSLVPLLERPDRELGRAVLTTFGPGNHALTLRGIRYIRYRGGEEELYDLTVDPLELRNLAAEPARRRDSETCRVRLAAELAPFSEK